MTKLRYMTEEEVLKFANSTPTKAQHYANRLTKRSSIVCETHLVDEVIKEYNGYMGETIIPFHVELEEAEEREGTPQTKITIVYKD
ncbi:hypothetical protein [Bacillus haynesii]|uniref:hypothetical protein n=1 Tax=Bacillus haynesii TaxID=1925021 RepID=UPI00228084B1|nr:hypothetical protein [Bacillus haynesii]MCY7861601.1 hypothetical protein [Bacillus haynesii]MCY9153909.1 hypothetical protein [Bacillus haynesii]